MKPYAIHSKATSKYYSFIFKSRSKAKVKYFGQHSCFFHYYFSKALPKRNKLVEYKSSRFSCSKGIVWPMIKFVTFIYILIYFKSRSNVKVIYFCMFENVFPNHM